MIKGLVLSESEFAYFRWIKLNGFVFNEYPLIKTVNRLLGYHMLPIYCIGNMRGNIVYNSSTYKRLIWSWQVWANKYFTGC